MMTKANSIYFLALCIQLVHCHILTVDKETVTERKRINSLVDLIRFNVKTNGWNNMLLVGEFPDSFYAEIRLFDFTVTNIISGGLGIENTVPYSSQFVVLSATDFDSFESALNEAINSPYWHPLSNIILYYHSREQVEIPRIFFIFWFYRACNVIIVQYDDAEEKLIVTYYSPYVSDSSELRRRFGCWKVTKLGVPPTRYNESFSCEEGCGNVSKDSQLRSTRLGTCIGFETISLDYGNVNDLKRDMFEDKGRNLHGFVLRAHAVEVLPFFSVDLHEDGSFTIGSRDGELWNGAAERMNFGIDLNATKAILKMDFDFEVNINLLYTFAQRQADLLLFPVYMFDLIVVEVDMSFPFKDGGVCILSHRADFETVLFQWKSLEGHYKTIVGFIVCFVSIWVFFVAYQYKEKGYVNLDMMGREFLNANRNVLAISISKTPNRDSFRIFLAISIWCFFAVSFISQASVISMFSSYKRGKEVDTFDDVIEKGYVIEGMASPDMILPGKEEKSSKINSKLVAVKDVTGCVKSMKNDSRRFCLIDCSMGRYMARNSLENGVQYLHIAKHKMHEYYLTMLLHKHSPLTASFNKYVLRCVEAGLITKWEQYKFYDVKEEARIRSLSLNELRLIFRFFAVLLGVSAVVFSLEVSAGVFVWVKRYYGKG